MCLPIRAVPPFLFESAYDPHAASFVAEVAAIFSELAPGFHVKEAHLVFKTAVLLVVAVGSKAEIANLSALRRAA
jgi:hypothetical protein